MNRNSLPKSSRETPCDLCSGTEFELVGKYDRKRRLLNTVICERCGLVSHERIPSDEELDIYYEIQYRHEYNGEYTPSAHRVLRAWEGGQGLVARLKRFLTADASVFEVGAGIGCTVKSFEKAGFNASGIEPGEGFHAYASNEIQANVQRATLDQVKPVGNHDLVVLSHVIEHFNSPRKSIQQIRQLLKNTGKLYVECPNIAAPHAAPRKLFHYAHIYNFTVPTLQMLIESCGFELTQAFTKPDDRTHSLLFSATAPRELEIIPNSYPTSLDGIFKYNTLTYHLRPAYLKDKFRRDTRFVSNHILPAFRLRNIFSASNTPSAGGSRKAA